MVREEAFMASDRCIRVLQQNYIAQAKSFIHFLAPLFSQETYIPLMKN